jgi:transposase InsO family protein
VHQRVRRFEAEGEAAFQPHTKRPHGNSRAIGPELEERIIRLRKELSKHGLDAARTPSALTCCGTTHWQLADGTGIEILNIEDDHSRLDLVSDARLTTGGEDVVTSRGFRRYGNPARVLTDNAAVFTGKPRRGCRVALEIELDLLGVRFDHSRPRHPLLTG